MTRRQEHLGRALAHVEAIAALADPDLQRVYGGLCHSLPVLVRTCGLCQTVAVVEAKAGPDSTQGRAYRRTRDHIAAAIGVEPGALLQTVRAANLADYMRYTRTVLEAWIFYKRFADAILDVDAATGVEAG